MSTAIHLISPARHMAALAHWLRLLRQYRSLTWELSRREVGERYAGQMLGTLWALGHPLLLMATYVFVFSYVFKAQLGGTPDMPLPYPAFLLAGLVPWLGFQEAITRAAVAIVANANLVKQVVFPVELLPIKSVMAALLGQTVSTAFLAGYVLFSVGWLPWTFALFPLLFLLQGLATCGVAYFLAAVGAYFRDVKDVLLVLLTIGLYLTPILYPERWVGQPLRYLLHLNPVSYLVWCYQDAFYFGRFEHWWAWLALPPASLLLFGAGYMFFHRLRPMFGNVL